MQRLASLILFSAAALAAPAVAQQKLPGKAVPQDPRSRMPVKEVAAGDDVRWIANWSLPEVLAKGEQPFSFAELLITKKGKGDIDAAAEAADAAGDADEGAGAADAKAEAAAARPELLVLCFWSYACPWQNAWDPEIDAIAEEYRERGVRLIGVDSNVKEVAAPDKIRAYRERTGIGFPILLDPGNRLADRFGAKTTPHIYLVDKRGEVLYTGAVDDDAHQKLAPEKRRPYLRQALDAALAGEEIAVTSSPPKGCGIKRAPRKKSDDVPARR